VFKEIKNRDAWSTIRGFVYQVDITIFRWLNLAENETLELEKGEDIDTVSKTLESDEISRTLEQIKFREGTTSLNTDLALELFFNFFLHRKNNPGKKLLFRFVSNAGYNLERPALFANAKTGVSVWQELYNEENVKSDDPRVLVIQKHLLRKIEQQILDPSEIDEKNKDIQQHWSSFKTLAEDQDTVLEFMKDFEWSSESHQITSITASIKELIKLSKHLPSQTNAELLYPRLFLFVFKLLTSSSGKYLDVASLIEQGNLPVLSEQDTAAFEIISGLLNNLEGRVSKVEESIASAIKQVSDLSEEMSLVKSSDAVFDMRLKNLSSTAPVNLKFGSSRTEKTKEICQAFSHTPWINFQGINGTGKTQLASLTCRQFKNFQWIELREYNSSLEKSVLLIEALLTQISKVPVKADRQSWIVDVLQKIPSNTLIVINDLPSISSGSPLNELLVLLAENLVQRQIFLLTTSNYNIPEPLIASLEADTFHEYSDISFTEDEIQELLVNNKAPEEILHYVGLFAAVSYCNPRILSAIVSRLKVIRWGADSADIFEVLFKKEFTSEILKDSQSSISSYITDDDVKQLLYRLTLIHYDYSFNMVQAVSEVDKKIEFPFEKLQGIVNIWVDDNKQLYKTSPLIHNLGVKNMSSETLKKVYAAIGSAVIKEKKLDYITAARAINAFISGEDFNTACIILISALGSAESEKAAEKLLKWGYLEYWKDSELPESMATILKTRLTTEQIRVCRLFREDTSVLMDRLAGIESQTADLSERVFVNIVILGTDASRDIKTFLSSLKFVLENMSVTKVPFKEALTPELLEGFFWMALQHLFTEEDTACWFDLADMLESKTGLDIFKNENAVITISVLAGHTVDNEKQKQTFQPTDLARRLDAIVKYFQDKKHEKLAAVILKERIALEFQVNRQIGLAEKMTIEYSGTFQCDEAKYLLFENLGKLYYNDSKNPKSTEWLEKAITINCKENATFTDTLVYGAASISEINSVSAVNYMQRAEALTKKKLWTTDLDNAQMLCELAIAYWKNNEFAKSYSTFNDAVLLLQKIKKDQTDKEWIRLTSWLAHSLGYISSSVAKDKVPSHLGDGEVYTVPYQGIFTFNTKDLSDLYEPRKDILILSQMAIFSEGIGDIENAYKWSLTAYDEARKTGDQSLIMMISTACSQYPLINFKINEHFEWALQFHGISAHLTGSPEQKYIDASKINFQDVLDKRPSSEWDSAENTIISLSIIPMFIMALNALNRNGTKTYQNELLNLIQNYIADASDKVLWREVHDLMEDIFEKQLTANFLVNEANKYGETNNKEYQIICLLGNIFMQIKAVGSLEPILNVFPYLTKILHHQPAVIRNVLAPFVKYYAVEAVKENYFGTKNELDSLLEELEASATSNKDSVQKLLLPAVDICEIKVTGDRKTWLTEFKEI
jgi:tetratricopeptide (TPR) repeat protein